MANKTDIFNMALLELGVSALITNIHDTNDNSASILNKIYETARDEVLKMFDWNFAEKYRELTLSKEQSLNPKFSFCFDYPNDCLCARELYEKRKVALKKQFKIASGEKGQKIILTNVNPCILKYTRKVVNENYFTSEFSSVLALYLAGKTGRAITGSEQKANNALNKFNNAIRIARISNAQEGEEVDEDNKTYIDYR